MYFEKYLNNRKYLRVIWVTYNIVVVV